MVIASLATEVHSPAPTPCVSIHTEKQTLQLTDCWSWCVEFLVRVTLLCRWASAMLSILIKTLNLSLASHFTQQSNYLTFGQLSALEPHVSATPTAPAYWWVANRLARVTKFMTAWPTTRRWLSAYLSCLTIAISCRSLSCGCDFSHVKLEITTWKREFWREGDNTTGA